MRIIFAGLILLTCVSAFAAEETPPPKDEMAHPVLPGDSSWAPVMLMVIGGMFVAAAVIGPIVRLNAPEEVPPAHAHDEPPGSSHHHGKSGLVNPDPDAPHSHGH